MNVLFAFSIITMLIISDRVKLMCIIDFFFNMYSHFRMNISSLLRPTQSTLSLYRKLNCWTAAITKTHRKLYLNTFSVHLVLPDGSSININYDEPRRIITLPVNIDELSQEEKRLRLGKRKTVTKAKVVEEYQDDFDETQFFK